MGLNNKVLEVVRRNVSTVTKEFMKKKTSTLHSSLPQNILEVIGKSLIQGFRPPIKRYIDDRPQVYRIVFTTNTQRNESTNYCRQIRRARTNVSLLSNPKWEYLNEHHRWVPFESLIQPQIEAS
jgi:hypothetical protein